MLITGQSNTHWWMTMHDINNMQICAVTVYTHVLVKFWAQFCSILPTDLVVIFQMKSKPMYNSQEIDPHCTLWDCELASYCSSELEKTRVQFWMDVLVCPPGSEELGSGGQWMTLSAHPSLCKICDT